MTLESHETVSPMLAADVLDEIQDFYPTPIPPVPPMYASFEPPLFPHKD
jgi:pseudouridine kinase